MKTLYFIAAFIMAAFTVSAQNKDEKSLTVTLLSSHEVDSLCSAREARELNRKAKDDAMRDYIETHRHGFQQTDTPQFVFATKDNKFSFSIGGFISLRAGYDFKGSVDNLDFITSDIPVQGTYDSKQKLMLEAATSRIYLKAISNTRALGRVVAYVETDFHGGAENSYTPRLRSAYISFKGLTLGRDVTTFCDLKSAPTTIDFQGPSAYPHFFTALARYEITFAQKHLTYGVAIEMPTVNAVYGDELNSIHQRMPDIPMYLQYAWGKDRDSHVRASGVVRNMYLHRIADDEATSLFGWGVQVSGTVKCASWLRMMAFGVYGEGISSYIQDLRGANLDFTPDPSNPLRAQTMPAWGVQAAAEVTLTPRITVSGGYSMVRVEHNNGYYADDQFRQGQYVFGNIFYALAPRCKIAAEYLHGSRKDMNGAKNTANRINMMVKYYF